MKILYTILQDKPILKIFFSACFSRRHVIWLKFVPFLKLISDLKPTHTPCTTVAIEVHVSLVASGWTLDWASVAFAACFWSHFSYPKTQPSPLSENSTLPETCDEATLENVGGSACSIFHVLGFCSHVTWSLHLHVVS